MDDGGAARRPGVVVFHGGAGLDDHARDRARRIAELGYVVLAADLYGDAARGRRDAIMALLGRFQNSPPFLRARATAALECLARQPLVDGRLAAVGYCLGGMTALELARSGARLTAAVSVHGSLRTEMPATQGTVSSRLLVCHGALDPHVPMAHVQAFVDEMTGAGADWEVQIYSGAQHGFTHDPAGPAQPGVAYHATADRRSSAALADWLAQAFGVAEAAPPS